MKKQKRLILYFLAVQVGMVWWEEQPSLNKDRKEEMNLYSIKVERWLSQLKLLSKKLLWAKCSRKYFWKRRESENLQPKYSKNASKIFQKQSRTLLRNNWAQKFPKFVHSSILLKLTFRHLLIVSTTWLMKTFLTRFKSTLEFCTFLMANAIHNKVLSQMKKSQIYKPLSTCLKYSRESPKSIRSPPSLRHLRTFTKNLLI